MSEIKIPVSSPLFNGKEKEYVMDCLDSTWISSNGKYINGFEDAYARYCGVSRAVACCNGTVALHLALICCGILPGDEVLIPSLTFVATANAVLYCGAIPVFVDSDPDTWNINVEDMKTKITEKTKAVIAVHLYGNPCDMSAITETAEEYGLSVIEDAAEAHGAEYKGRRIGSLSDAAAFSFYGNKIITCGEGGMVVTDNRELADRVSLIKGQGMSPDRRYWFECMGYNYRMTNIAAALGMAQLEQIEVFLAKRREIYNLYRNNLCNDSVMFQIDQPDALNACWMFSVLIDVSEEERDRFMMELAGKGIETRPVFYPMHRLPYLKKYARGECRCAENIASGGINLPTWPGLSRDNIEYVCDSLRNLL